MANYTHLSSISVKGSIRTSLQGKLIGTFDTMPEASSQNEGLTILYTGPTGTYVQGRYYVSDGVNWSLSAASPDMITVDSALSDTSTNPVQNKVIKEALDAKTYKAGTGLFLAADGVTINHANSISEVTEYIGGANAVPRIMYDGQGHIKVVSTAAIYPPTTKGQAGQVWVSDGDVGGQWEDKPSEGPQGPQGPQGPKGDDGATPVRGVDYWTDADKQEIISGVLASLPVAEGGSF